VRPVHLSSPGRICGYTQVSVCGEPGQPLYSIVGVTSCGRAAHPRSRRCKHHMRAAPFEVWAIRDAASQRGGHQAMLLHACNSPRQLESYFSLRKGSLQVGGNVAMQAAQTLMKCSRMR
jgi:hypothetical protein